MDIICKQCNATYSIPATKLPKRKASAECKRCGSKIVINAATSEDSSSVAQAPALAPTTAPAPRHDGNILSVFQEISDFDPAHYDPSAFLKANKKGNYKTGINKFKVKILTAVKPTLDRMLRKDEQVLRVAGGTAYYPIEILFGNGLFTMLYNRFAVVATNQRLVMINTNARMTDTRHYLFQMNYSEIKKVSRGLFRTSLTLTPKKGKRRVFTSMKKAFAAELLDFIKPRIDPQEILSAETEIKPNLCPACLSSLGSKLTQCSSCHAAFKKPAAAALRSLVLPGLGDLYLGHRFLGCCEILGSLFVWFLVLSMLMAGGVEGIVFAVILLIFCNGIDALLTLHMGKKGYILAKKQPLADSHPQLAASNA